MDTRTLLQSVIILIFGVGALCSGYITDNVDNHETSWEILIFTQTWPNTLCYSWKHKNESNSCYLPSDKKLWTVHGLWPTKLGTKGPGFCNTSSVFNPEALEHIKYELNEYWPDIEDGPMKTTEVDSLNLYMSHEKKSIWFHEWTKHGTCAASLPTLSSEFKYFSQGIEWAKKYNMKDVLEKAGIKVNSKLYVKNYWKAVKSVLKRNVWIQCLHNHVTKEQMLEEIRICFDKTLKLINCKGITTITHHHHHHYHLLTNCNKKQPILYLDEVPKEI